MRVPIISHTFISHNCLFEACTIPIEIAAFNRGDKINRINKNHITFFVMQYFMLDGFHVHKACFTVIRNSKPLKCMMLA